MRLNIGKSSPILLVLWSHVLRVKNLSESIRLVVIETGWNVDELDLNANDTSLSYRGVLGSGLEEGGPGAGAVVGPLTAQSAHFPVH